MIRSWQTCIFLVILSIIYVELEARGTQWQCPPSEPKCDCNSRLTNKTRIPYRADCSNQNLNHIPKLIQNYTKLKFSGNILPRINRTTFVNLRKLPISELFLNTCKIEHVDADTFNDLHFLEFIDFSNNSKINISQLATCFRTTNLIGIALSDIPLGRYVVDFFNTSAAEKLKFVRLAACNITALTHEMFEHLQNLIELDVSRNILYSIDMTVIPPVKVFSAKYTELSVLKFPSNITSSLTRLDLSNNRFTNLSLFYHYSHVFKHLEDLYTDSNPIDFLPIETFSQLSVLNSLSLCNITSYLHVFAGINNSALRHLNLSYNEISPKYSKTFLKDAPNLKYLKMDSVDMSKWTDSDITAFLQPLCSTLDHLLLPRTYFKSIPSNALRCFKKLKVLDLSSNNISSWDHKTFVNVTIKSQLLLKNNKLEIIKENFFPRNIIDGYGIHRLPYLDFKGNPFSCTCEIHWFRTWLRTGYFRFRGSRGNNYLCHSPEHLKNTPFVDYDPDYEDCFSMNMAIVVALSLCGACMVLVTSTSYILNLYRKRYPEKQYYRIVN